MPENNELPIEDYKFFEKLLSKICDEYRSYQDYTIASRNLYNKTKKVFSSNGKDGSGDTKFESIVNSKGFQKIDPISLISYIAGNTERSQIIKSIYFKGEDIKIPEKKNIPSFNNIGLFIIQKSNKGNENLLFDKLWNFAYKLKDNKIDKETFNNVIAKGIQVSNLSAVMFICNPYDYYSIDRESTKYIINNLDYNTLSESDKKRIKTLEKNKRINTQFSKGILSFDKLKQIDYSDIFSTLANIADYGYSQQVLGESKDFEVFEKIQSFCREYFTRPVDFYIDVKHSNYPPNSLKKQNYNLEEKGKGDMILEIQNQPRNQILYGPPGTGKTYNTVVEAIRIIDADLLNKYENKDIKYEDLKKEFDNYKKQGCIEFITFHQSYGYEDFIEGIKPSIGDENDDDIDYDIVDGIFKRISNNALYDRLSDENQNDSFKFQNIIKEFIERYPIGVKLETTKSSFKIVKYTEKSMIITVNDENHRYSITYKYLEEAFNRGFETREQLEDINGLSKGLSYYYDRVYQEFLDINKKDINKNIELDKINISREDKLNLIKKYYDGDKKVKLKDAKNSKPYVLIIDEINRGNISKILGELITLLEDDKRENFSVKLPYSHEEFTVPKNLYIIGTMNTADRSIALMDTALRRRFEFVEMMPNHELFVEANGKHLRIGDIDIYEMLKKMNERIEALYDREHTIGHAFFMPLKKDDTEENKLKELSKIFKNKIIPLLQEYFYDDYSKIQLVLGDNQVTDELVKKKLKEKNKDEKKLIEVKKALQFLVDEEISNDLFGEGGNEKVKNRASNKIKYYIDLSAKSFNNPHAYQKIYNTLKVYIEERIGETIDELFKSEEIETATKIK